MAAPGDGYAPDLAAAMVTAPTPPGDWLVIAPVVLTLLWGALLVMLHQRAALQARIAVAGLVGLVVVTALLLARVVENGPVVMTMGRWLPPFGISFVADALGATLAFAASLAALAVAVFAARDLAPGVRRYGFYPFLMALMAGVCGSLLTGDVFNLYVWFEVLLIASFGLIVLGNSRAQLDGALRYALLNFLATTFFLIATGLLYGAVGTLNMADIAQRMRELPPGAPVHAISALFILGFAMKAAVVPLNFWLPASYHTPAACVSALFAGLLTKVGAYALLRVLVMVMPAGREVYAEVLVWLAVLTMLVGALGALAQSNLRRLLGYLVISGIGVILAGIALGTPTGVAGAIVYSVHSMIAMTALYLAAGVAERLARASRLQEMGGLAGASPLLATITLVLVFAVAGLPPFSGFWPKVVVTQAALLEERWWLAAAVLLTGLLTLGAAGRAFAHAFWRGGPLGTPDGAEKTAPGRLSAGEARILVWPPAALALVVLFLGLWPAPLLWLADTAAAGLLDPSGYVGAVLGGHE